MSDNQPEINGKITHGDGSRRTDYLFRVSLKAIIFNTNGEILVVKEAGRDWWDLPGGGMDHGESIKSTLARELHEEVSLTGEFEYRALSVKDPNYLSAHNLYQICLIFLVTPENMSFTSGDDGDAVRFIEPTEFRHSDHAAERKVYEYSRLAQIHTL